MNKETIKIVTPKDWRRIHPDYYKDFSIVNNAESPCEYGFAIENGSGNYDVVSIFNYGNLGPTFVNELKNHLDLLSKDDKDVDDINNYISKNAEGYAVTQTESLKPIFYKSGKLVGKQSFINVMKIATNLGSSYSLQIFREINNNIYCFSTSVAQLNEKDPFNSLLENEYIQILINEIIAKL